MIRMHAKGIKGSLELVYRDRALVRGPSRVSCSLPRSPSARNADARYPRKRLASRSLSLSLSLCISFPRKANTGTKAKVRGGAGLPLQSHTPSVIRTPRPSSRRGTATEAFSRRAECLRAVRKLSGSRRVRAGRDEAGRLVDGWKRKDRRLKCRFRATLQHPRKRPLFLPDPAALNALTSPPPGRDLRSPTFLVLPALVSSRALSPLATPEPPPIYLVLRLTLGLSAWVSPKEISVRDGRLFGYLVECESDRLTFQRCCCCCCC